MFCLLCYVVPNNLQQHSKNSTGFHYINTRFLKNRTYTL